MFLLLGFDEAKDFRLVADAARLNLKMILMKQSLIIFRVTLLHFL